MKDKKPNIESAAVTVRVISRLLKKNGFVMSTKVDKHNSNYPRTDGCYVRRRGLSNYVMIDYFTNWNKVVYTRSKAEEIKKKADELFTKIRQFLSEYGYVFENKSWLEIKCEKD